MERVRFKVQVTKGGLVRPTYRVVRSGLELEHIYIYWLLRIAVIIIGVSATLRYLVINILIARERIYLGE